eukprot:m.112682 g.112682  ORF g.112682 m.112682 type:complete len:102 (-) comp19291_c0_seq4:108-413(-)
MQCLGRWGFFLLSLCSKGTVVRQLLSQPAVPRKVVYVGDGRNDFCAAANLRKGDVVLARAGFSLERLLQEQRMEVAATALVWETYDQLAQLLREHSAISVS